MDLKGENYEAHKPLIEYDIDDVGLVAGNKRLTKYLNKWNVIKKDICKLIIEK